MQTTVIERHPPLDRTVCVVTGAAGGIGAAIADHLLGLGARVAFLDLPASLSAMQPHQEVAAGRTVAVGCDVTDHSSVEDAAARVLADLGPCEVLVNNAGVLAPHESLVEMDLAQWDRSMDINLRGPLLCMRAFGHHMLARKAGIIINIASIAGHKPNASPSYSVSKAGLLALTRHAAVEWGPRGIRTNSVSPGFIRTPLSAGHYSSSEKTQDRINAVPLRRLGSVEDVASAVAFLASAASSFVNGQDLVVDGGFLETVLMHAQPKADQYGGFFNHPST